MNQIRRENHLARTDRTDLDAVLDAAAVGTLATVVDGLPWVVPMLYARDGDRVVLHGSTGAGALRHVAAGAPAAFCVTILDGIVVADTLFESTANYRSAVVRGHLTVIDPHEAADALDLMSDSLIPGRSAEVRSSTKKELAATLAVTLPIEPEGWTVKVRDAPPSPPDEAADSSGWAGVVPLRTVAGEPIPAPWVDTDAPPPASVHRLINGN
ncbi:MULTISPECIES: pyridoxamine 5'-phosphate oxidase family protein [unclassified Mycolicibacterium]|uniref:pyridoxamine 5'-phosphate oxidase family protein n=1 Tax=unclassified Mycolicibacterium TaxID=2636767 RepID=UPI001309714B|nr:MULTISPECIES: pyridoxamine 5'-phosphate oxidase family protein [unclassified Mycolicibacterium]MUL85705.1 pyridoxamine 5'-phosphate oxidase family protein [Mycolicibacterium sp. CBMA 329]MUL91582.1 pyridoxamine 5'-phosphate oxidase family protein [Mycolicibacterium sp. CBMA 331]MUM02178.1 pyridoxamine 5'-phosphate oxidase family protein [Mycolicibacterium sp. CBMA 334]MUM28010.1 pyridoxamine 5'-phosphate oxidase family protein [Mycolicibacterium sp. CBMA 295]MUM41128.1 pyridoxamine 5'-phosp